MEVEIETPITSTANAKLLKVCAKVSDCFSATLLSSDGAELCEYDGYVPKFFPGDHGQDYLILDIDIDTGQIVNWKQPSKYDIQNFIRSED